MSGRDEFQLILKHQLPAFVLSFGSDWRLQTISRSLCNNVFCKATSRQFFTKSPSVRGWITWQLNGIS